MSATSDLFTPGRLGAVEIPNRVLMAPMTRSRAGRDGVPGPLAQLYYAQRASAGLIVTEATQVTPAGQGYITVTFPGSANVYISGKYLGPANKPLQVRCGTWFVRLARPIDAKFPEWVTLGKTVNVTCQGSTRMMMQPIPGKPVD